MYFDSEIQIIIVLIAVILILIVLSYGKLKRIIDDFFKLLTIDPQNTCNINYILLNIIQLKLQVA